VTDSLAAELVNPLSYDAMPASSSVV